MPAGSAAAAAAAPGTDARRERRCLGASAAGAIPHIGKRVIAMIGDGSFQVTAQDVSTMIRFAYNPIIFLVNNNGYTIEVEIHDGPYNNIPSWNYTKVVEALAGDMPVHTATCATEEALLEALPGLQRCFHRQPSSSSTRRRSPSSA